MDIWQISPWYIINDSSNQSFSEICNDLHSTAEDFDVCVGVYLFVFPLHT